MAETYGALEIPIQLPTVATDAVSDPALSRVTEYLKAYLNAYGQTAWARVFPALQTSGAGNGPVPLVRTIFTHDPTEYVFSDAHLPALYLTRTGGSKFEWPAEDYRIAADLWNLVWVFPKGTQANQRQRDSFTNGLAKLIDAAIERVRDPVWAWDLDTDTKAASIAADPVAIKLSTASSASAQSYTGAGLDGAVGASLLAPGRHPTVTLAGTVTDVLAGSTVTFTGLGDDGTARTSTVTLDADAGRYDGDWLLTRVDSIDVDAQLGTGATLTFGLDAFAGRGTSVLTAAGLQMLEVASWSDKMIAIKMAGDSPPQTYDALEIKLKTEERWLQDTEALDEPGLGAAITYSDGAGVYERFTLS